MAPELAGKSDRELLEEAVQVLRYLEEAMPDKADRDQLHEVLGILRFLEATVRRALTIPVVKGWFK